MNAKRYLLLYLIILHQLFLSSGVASTLPQDKEAEMIQQARSTFNELIELWYEQKFAEIYARFAYQPNSGMSKEKFINRMTKEKKRLACCWQKVQDVKVKLSSYHQVSVHAKFGFEDSSNEIVYVTTEIPLYLKDQKWHIKVKDILSTAPDLSSRTSKKR